MKKLLIAIIATLFCAVSTAQNKVLLSTTDGVPGDVVTVDVALQNSDEVTAVEVVIPLVEKQLTYVDGSCVINSERANGHSLNAAVVDGALKIYIYSISLAPLKGNDGQIASFSLKLGKLPAEYPLQPQVLLSDAAGKALPVSVDNGVVTLLAPQIEVVTQSVDFGHVPIMLQYTKNFTLRNSGTLPLTVTGIESDDSDFSVAETAFTIPAGATKSVAVEYSPKKRGAVESAVTILSNATNGNASVKLLADPYSVNELHSNRVEGSLGEEVTVELRMNNMEPIVGVQTTFTLPAGIEYVDGSFASAERASSHTAMASVRDNKLTLILYSLNNTPVSGNDGVVATFRLKLDCNSGNYRFEPQNTVLSNAAVENMMSAVSGDYIVVKSPDLRGENALDFGKTPVTEVAKANYSVRNNGRATLVISSVAFLAEGYRVANELPLSIEPGATSMLNVEYLPTKEGEHSTTMNIYSNDPDENMKPVKLSGTIYEPNNLTFEGENLQNGDYVVSIGLDNYTGIVAMQMDIHWLPGMTTSSDGLKVSERLSGHSCSITKMDEDTYRFIAFSFGNNNIAGNEGKLFDLTFTPVNGVEYKDTPILIDNVVLSSSGANNYTSQLALNVPASYSHYYVRFICEGKVVSETFQKVGSTVVYPQMPDREGHSFHWELEGGNKTLAYPIDLASNANEMLYSNAYCTIGGDNFQGWHVLFDDNTGTFFHSEYASNKTSTDGLHHYLRVDLGAGNEVEKFSFTYATRRGSSSGSPTRMVVEGANSADGPYSEIAVLTGMPTYNSTYSSDTLGNGNKYRYIRFRVINTSSNQSPSGHPFFYISEFGMTKYVKVPTLLETVPSNDVVLNGLYTPNNYRVTYKVDGEIVATDSVVYGNEIVLREHPVKEGHTFSGWSEVPATMPASDITIEGSFAVNSYNVIYKVDGEDYNVVPVTYGSEIILIEAPTKEGCTFSGWSEVPATMPAEDVTIEGTFTVNRYAVHYKVDGDGFAIDSVAYGSEIVLRENPTKEGHTFSGWSEVPATMPANDVVINGTFAVNNYNVIYKIDGEEYKIVPVAYGAPVSLIDAPVKEGHTFRGWEGEMQDGIIAYPIDLASNADNMLYSNAYCTDKTYGDEFKGWHVLFDNNPATFFHSEYNPNVKESSDGLEHYIRIDLGTGNEVEKFSFTYSNRQSSSTGSPTKIVVEGCNEANGVYAEIATLTGLPTYNSTYSSDTLGNGNKYRFIRLRVTETYSNQSPSGHPFFYISELGMTKYVERLSIPTVMPAEDVVINGTFTVNSYNVIYKVDGEVFAVDSIAYGNEIVLREHPTKEGHTFSGWSEASATMPAEDVTINGAFTVNSYNVIYKVDGEVYATETVAYGSDIVLRDEPTKEGHTFSGWSEAPATMPAEDVTIEGTFAVNRYAVNYKVDGVGFAVDSVAYGSEIILREEPNKEGHTFSGWSEAPATMPAEDIVIEGSFALNTYNVIYKVDGEVYATDSVLYGNEIVLREHPVKEGHTFSGWSEVPATMPASDITIEGSFTINNYTVTYLVDGEIYATETVAYGSEIILREEPVKEGHTFSGWSEAPATMPAEGITIEGTFTVNSYNVIYKVDGEEYQVVPVTYGSEITFIEAPTKEGHTFSGWSEAPATMPASDITIEGSFAVNTYNVTYKVDGEEFQVVPVTYGSEITLLDEPTKEGHTFSGWSEAPATMPASDITIEGSFTVNNYTVTYLVDGEVYTTETVAYGSEIVLRDEPTKEGHTFSGWSEAPATMPAEDVVIKGTFAVNYYNVVYFVDGEVYVTDRIAYGKEIVAPEPPVKEGYTFGGWRDVPKTMPAEDIEITSSFVVNGYKVIYKVDGEEYQSELVEYGSMIILPKYPIKEGHTFSGWQNVPESMPAEDITIEGAFTVNSYNVIYKVDGEEYKVVPVTYGSEITLIEAPTKEGHTFSGWSEAPATMPASDITIEGSFAVNSYNVIYKLDGEEYKVIPSAYGSEIILIDAPVKEGHTFSGWSEAPTTMPAEDVVIKGTFVVNYYNVVYLVDGEVYVTDRIAYGKEIVAPEPPVKEGYTFGGWRDVPKTMPAEDIEITSSFVVNGYKVIYKVDGEEYQSELVEYGSMIILPKYPIKEGHTFSGWSEAPATMPAEDVVIEGSFTVNIYNVIYKVDGEEFQVVPITYGSEITLIEAPTKEGHTFSGWSEVPATMPAKDVTIEGVFTVNSYAVKYVVDGEEFATDSIAFGAEIVLREQPTKEGYTFSGWSEAPETMPASDITIEGSFAVNSYVVKYLVDGEEFATDSIAFGSEIVLREQPTKEGHTFSGWSDAPATMPAKDVTIEGTFTVNSYVVKYLVDGEEFATDSIAFGAEIVLREEPTKEGYTFSGWSEAPATMPAKDVTIEGVFTVNSYVVKYLVDGEEFATDSIAFGSEIVLREQPTKEGHTFSGWSEAPETMPAEDVVIEGSFTVNTYNVIYKVDGEEYKVVPAAYGSEIVLIYAPVKEGHTFSGWSDAPATMPAEDVVIEGSFTVNNYTVTYLVDGEVYATETVAYGSAITLLEEPTKEGYTFSGWSEAPATMPAEDIVIEGSFSPITTINGVVYDAENLLIYNLRGERIIDVDELERGIYIINGKKVWVE